ncbi:hypothetical protein PIROE2DRAFT_57442 [Piromyces sp. E2]|nr:hypothetical protein PIROE2DRAFT_57442 [Piromyces sp. E2]|eukprot:OUM69392.1 hypothetical protein PIROE2DRAFT_57442 [Piromyces sp. E2]
MKFQNIFSLYVIAIVFTIYPIIAEPICEDEEGNIIPCQKVVDKIEDFELASSKTKKKRDYYSDWLREWLWNPWSWWPSGPISGPISGGGYTISNGNRRTTKTVNRRTTAKTLPKTVPKTVPKTAQPKRTTSIASKPTPISNGNTNNNANNNASNNNALGLDKKPFTMTGFINCNAEQKAKVERTIDDIITYRAAGLRVAKDTTDAQNKQIFVKFFKNEGVRNQVVKVLNNVNNMSTATAYCEPNTDSACRQQAIAWTYLNSREFHVCPAFFTQIFHGTIEKHTSEAASVILHELTHCFGTDDYAYGDAGCNRLDASKASNNADTFRLFCMNAIYHLNDKKSGIMRFTNDTNIDFRTEPFQDKVIIRAVERKNNY